MAQRQIYIQTPNLTSRVVLDAIVAALKRGVDIYIVTSQRLMILEQIVTARTTTTRCVRWLSRKHSEMLKHKQYHSAHDVEANVDHIIGSLQIFFYTPRRGCQPPDPVQTHLKLMVVDDEISVLGSGNLDRASFVTSQELGVALVDSDFSRKIRTELAARLEGRLHRVV